MEDRSLNQKNPDENFPQAVAKFIKQRFIDIDKIARGPQTDLKKEIASAITKKDLGSAIMKTIEYIDFKQGIFWYVFPAHSLGCASKPVKEILIRDARKLCPPGEIKEAYLVMALNSIRVAKALLSEEQFEQINSYLFLILRNFYIQVMNENTTEIQNYLGLFNTVLINNVALLLQLNFEEVYQQFIVAKDFVNLEDESRHVVTLSSLKNDKGEKITVFQAEFALTALTEPIKEEYLNCSSSIWFEKLPDWQKKLMRKYIPLILTETKVLPTQLRKIPIIGLRNAYETINGVLEPDAVVTTHAFHSGTLVTLCTTASENIRIGKLHGEQLRQHTRSKEVLALTLNSGINPTGHDKVIVRGTGQIAKDAGLQHVNLPLNKARKISSNIYKGVNFLLELCEKTIIYEFTQSEWLDHQDKIKFDKISVHLLSEDAYPERSYQLNILFLNYIQGCFKDNISLDASTRTRLKQCIEILKIALEIRYTMLNNTLFDANNRNLTLGSYLNILVTKLEPFAEIAINSSCESGKDRDAILMFRTALASYHNILIGTYSLNDKKHGKIIKENILRLAEARHFQLLAGFQGGSIGAFGIKRDSIGVIPENEFPPEAAEILIEKTASYNKNLLKAEKNDKIYYPIGNTNIKLQILSVCHVLLVQENLIMTLLDSKANYLGSLKIKSLRLPHLTDTIEKIQKTLTEKSTLEDLLKIINSCADSQKALTEGTHHGIGDTYKLLESISENLQQIIDSVNDNARKLTI